MKTLKTYGDTIDPKSQSSVMSYDPQKFYNTNRMPSFDILSLENNRFLKLKDLH